MKDSDWKLPSEQYLTSTQGGMQGGKAQDEKDLRKSLTILEMTRRVIEPDYPLLAENIKTHLEQFKVK